MQMKPVPPNPELDRLIAESRARYDAMTPEQRKAQHDAQRESWVRGEMSWPKDCPYR